MNKIPLELKIKVEEKIKDCLDVYKTQMQIKIVYKDIGTVAGNAHFSSHTITLSETLLLKYRDEFIARTVVHEVAHLIHHRFYPQDFLRGQRRLHGENWKAVMRSLGAETSRCHSYDVSEISNVRERPYQYTCGCKDNVFNLTQLLHNRIRNGQERHCRKCKVVIKPKVNA